MRKLLGKSAPDTSTDVSASSSSTSNLIAYRPLKSQNAVYAAGVPISTLDVSPDRRVVLLAGPHVLKTVVLDDPKGYDFRFNEAHDVRAAIISHNSGTKANASADQLNVRDAKWQNNSSFYTACANGRIFAYDVARIGAGDAEPLEYIQLQEDSRQVNTLDVNPHSSNWLLSGSQDGLARVFETGAPIHTRTGLTFRQRWPAMRCIDSIRQVKWSPRVGTEVACCTESGVVTKWDVRNPNRPLLRINAHERACTGISWHPDGIHLLSAGSDMKLHVWDLGSGADKRQKAKYSLQMPAPVLAAAWRPGLWSATAQSRRVAQVAVSYEDAGPQRYGTAAVHIWDLARPTNAYKEIERFDNAPSALLWRDQDLLWTVGTDGFFNQCDTAYAPKAVDRQSTSAMAFSPRGDVLMFLDERPQEPRRRLSVSYKPDVPGSRGSFSSSPQTPMLSVSKSDSEEDVLGSFLNPRAKRHHKRRSSARGQNLSMTPPVPLAEATNKAMSLDQAIKLTGVFKPQQAMASGHVPSAKSVSLYHYLSSSYLEILKKDLPYVEGGRTMVQRVTDIMEQYAKAAESASQFRLSQTWRILSFAMSSLLTRRAQYHLESRLTRTQKLKSDSKRDLSRMRSRDTLGDETPRRPSGHFLGSRSLLSEELDSTSNVATPKARPADEEDNIDHQDQAYQYGRRLTPIVEPASFSIGPAAHGSFEEDAPRRRLDSEPLSLTSQGSDHSQMSSTEGYDFYDTDALAHAIDVPSPKDGQTWAHDDREEQKAKALRRDSEESYDHVFSISDGSKPSTVHDSAFKGGFVRPKLAAQSSDLTSSSSGDFGSRIRGDNFDTSPEKRRHSSRDSEEEIFMISQTTMASDDTSPSQTSFPSQPDSDYHQLDASVHTLVPEPVPSRNSSFAKLPSFQYEPRTPHIIESDYLPWSDDPTYPFPLFAASKTPLAPLDPYKLLTRALEFESRTSALNASAIVLLLKPLVPEAIIDFHQANAILRQQHARLMSMSLFVEAALLRNLCVKGWPTGLPTWGETYTSIFSPAQQNVKVGFSCSSCHKPREVDPGNSGSSIWTCERCKASMAPCAVCGHRSPEAPSHNPLDCPDESLPQWWYCPGCTHGGHASCLALWHELSSPTEKYSVGCCPLDGCGHACLPGKYRVETTTTRAEVVAAQSTRSSGYSTPQGRGIERDGNEVAQSRAVGMAREMVGGANVSGSSSGILSSSPRRDRERRKSVKFATHER